MGEDRKKEKSKSICTVLSDLFPLSSQQESWKSLSLAARNDQTPL